MDEASFAIREMCISIARWYHDDGPIDAERVARKDTEFALTIVDVALLSTGPAERGTARRRSGAGPRVCGHRVRGRRRG